MIYLTEVTGGCVNTLRPKIINFQPLYYNYNYKTMFLTEVIDSCVNTQWQEIINCQPLIIKLLLYETYEVKLLIISSCLTFKLCQKIILHNALRDTFCTSQAGANTKYLDFILFSHILMS